MDGSATLTIVTSSTTMNCARHAITSTSQRLTLCGVETGEEDAVALMGRLRWSGVTAVT
jgi:hypothetical protein